MTTPGSDPEKPGSNPDAKSGTNRAQRRARQEKARAVRDAERRAARRKQRLVVGGVVVAVLVLAAVIGIVVNSSRSGNKGPVTIPGTAVTTGSPVAQSGILIGQASAPVTLDLYEDFNCPICGQFEKAFGSSITDMIHQNKIAVRYHMLSFIDDHNGGTYSHRSSGAFAAADTYGTPEQALALHSALYANQPDESSSTGLPNTKIISLASDAGITSQQFVDAVTKNSFASWVQRVADDGSKAGVTGTPTIYVNEKQVQLQSLANAQGQLDPTKLAQAVAAAQK
jgi:protein-disulfide isomerase